MRISDNFYVGFVWVVLLNLLIMVIWTFSGCAGNKAIPESTGNSGKHEIDPNSRDYQQGFLEGIIFCGKANDKWKDQ